MFANVFKVFIPVLKIMQLYLQQMQVFDFVDWNCFVFQYYTPANQIGGANEQEQAHSNTHTQVWKIHIL